MKNITKQELEDLYWNNTNVEVCRLLGITKATLVKYIKEAKIPLKGKGGGLVGSSSKKLNLVG